MILTVPVLLQANKQTALATPNLFSQKAIKSFIKGRLFLSNTNNHQDSELLAKPGKEPFSVRK